jgi:hypothetical protein
LTCLIRASGSQTPVFSIAAASGQFPDAFADAMIEDAPKELLAGIQHALFGAMQRSRKAQQHCFV